MKSPIQNPVKNIFIPFLGKEFFSCETTPTDINNGF